MSIAVEIWSNAKEASLSEPECFQISQWRRILKIPCHGLSNGKRMWHVELIILWVWRTSILKSATKEPAKNNLDLLKIQVAWVKCGLETMDDYVRKKWSLFRDGYFHTGYDDISATMQVIRVRRWLVVLVYRTFGALSLDVRIILKWKLNRNWGWYLH